MKWLSIIVLTLFAACARERPQLEVHVESTLDLPGEAQLLYAEVLQPKIGDPLDIDLRERRAPYGFRVTAGDEVPDRIAVAVALFRAGDRAMLASGSATLPFPANGTDCVRLFIPESSSDLRTAFAPCGQPLPEAPADGATPIADAAPADATLVVEDAAAPDAGQPAEAGIPPDDAAAIDAEVELPDAGPPPDAPPAFDFRYPPSNIDMTLPTAFTGTFDVNGSCTFDTTALTLSGSCGLNLPPPVERTQRGGPNVAFLSVNVMFVRAASTLTITGSRPAVILVQRDATISAAGNVELRASGTSDGPGVDRAACTSNGRTAATAGTNFTGPAGGGGGFGVAGAEGGGASGGSVTGGAAGLAGGNDALVPLIAGCPGSAAKGQAQAITEGGGGGGALQISAGERLQIHGTIDASGGGGRAGNDTEGGGGGGSGGAILLEGYNVDIQPMARVVANGGGGGGGGSNVVAGMPGADGAVDETALGGSGGDGGAGDNPAGTGGNGGTRNAPTAGGHGGFGSGGGGGGGASGRIRVNAFHSCQSVAGTSFSPDPTNNGGC